MDAGDPMNAGASADARSASACFCPMCEGVESDALGVCPRCGMALEARAGAAPDDDAELRDMRRRFRVSLVFALPLMAVAMGDGWFGHPIERALGFQGFAALQLALAFAPVFYGGAPLFGRGFASLRSGHLNMFTLISLGAGAAFVASLVAGIFPEAVPGTFQVASGRPPLFFEAAAVIVTLVLLGQVLELRARERASSALRALLELTPDEATRIDANGEETTVPIGHVAVGDRLRVRPGERVPLDGTLQAGATAIDESMMTGEAIPVERGPGDAVIGGSINGSGSFQMEVTRVGADTLLSRIGKRVASAQATRAPAQRLADRVSAIFVPAVIAIALIALAAWTVLGPAPGLAHGWSAAVAVLIIACPCALGLATPMAVTVGMGRGASDGLLFRNAEALERLRDVNVLVVDKTGTLTEGHPELVATVAQGTFGDGELLRLAACLERASEHPLAASIVRAALERGLEVEPVADFASSPGQGASGRVGGRWIRLGSEAYLAAHGIDVEPYDREADFHRREARSVVWVAVEDALAGLLVLEDPVKASTPEALEGLRDAGIRLVMASGDARATAESIGRRLRLDEVHAELLPQDKACLIERLKSEGWVVAMAGDGVNDAPALATADVGIAMSDGADVAIDAASVALLKGDLRGIVRALRLGRATVRTIRQNLGFAFLYNAMGVPIAAGALYPLLGWTLHPMLGAAAMSLSSVSVIANALRLARAKL